MFKYSSQEEKVINQLYDLIDNNKLAEARVDRSLKRILETKEKYNVNDEPIYIDEEFVTNINSEIEEIRQKCNL